MPHNNKNTLIMLCGMPRSGTTWIGKIFDSHPQTLYLHEPDSYDKMNVPMMADFRQADMYETHIQNYVDRLDTNTAVEVFGKMPMFSKKYMSPANQFFLKQNILISKIAKRLSLSLPIVVSKGRTRNRSRISVWKSIQSSGRIGLLTRCIKDSKTVQIFRHPAGQVASVLRGQALNKFDSAVDDDNILRQLLDSKQAARRTEKFQDLKQMTIEERQAWKWIIVNEKAMDDLDNVPNATLVLYEDICKNPVNESKKLFEFTGLPWNRQTEKFLGVSTKQSSDSYYSVQKKSMEVANRWKVELTEKQIERIMNMVRGSRAGHLYGIQ